MGRSCGIVGEMREEYSGVIMDYCVSGGAGRERKGGERKGMWRGGCRGMGSGIGYE